MEKKSITAPAFLEKLYEILENPELESHIAWQPDGLSFLIKQPNAFSETILPNYFKHNNIQSFVRQLNMYSFTKTRHDSNFREFRQPNFQKGRRDLLALIKRKTQGVSHTTRQVGDGTFSAVGVDPYDDDAEDGCFSAGTGCDGAASSSPPSSATDKAESDSVASSQIDELRSYIEKLETQVWTLNERHRVLSSKYEQLQERFTVFERAQNGSLRNDDADDRMGRDSDVTDDDQSRYSPTSATSSSSSSSSLPIVRMISIDPSVGRRSAGEGENHSHNRIQCPGLIEGAPIAVRGLPFQNKRDADVDPDCKTPKAAKCDHAKTDNVQGGLHAIAVAASLLEMHP